MQISCVMLILYIYHEFMEINDKHECQKIFFMILSELCIKITKRIMMTRKDLSCSYANFIIPRNQVLDVSEN